MILRNYKGNTKTVGRQQVNSEFLYRAVKKVSNEFPILQEARREVLEDLMDINNTKLVLQMIRSGNIKIKNRTIPIPSPFSLSLMIRRPPRSTRMESSAASDVYKRQHYMVEG